MTMRRPPPGVISMDAARLELVVMGYPASAVRLIRR